MKEFDFYTINQWFTCSQLIGFWVKLIEKLESVEAVPAPLKSIVTKFIQTEKLRQMWNSFPRQKTDWEIARMCKSLAPTCLLSSIGFAIIYAETKLENTKLQRFTENQAKIIEISQKYNWNIWTNSIKTIDITVKLGWKLSPVVFYR